MNDNDTSGFYKLDGEELLFAPNFVYAPAYSLVRGAYQELPYDGWSWYSSENDARRALGI